MVWGIDMSGRSGNGRFGPYTNGVSDNNGSAHDVNATPSHLRGALS